MKLTLTLTVYLLVFAVAAHLFRAYMDASVIVSLILAIGCVGAFGYFFVPLSVFDGDTSNDSDCDPDLDL